MAHFRSNLTQYSSAFLHKKSVDFIDHQVKCLRNVVLLHC